MTGESDPGELVLLQTEAFSDEVQAVAGQCPSGLVAGERDARVHERLGTAVAGEAVVAASGDVGEKVGVGVGLSLVLVVSSVQDAVETKGAGKGVQVGVLP